MKTDSFSITQRKTSWIYLDRALLCNFKVSLLSPDRLGGILPKYIAADVGICVDLMRSGLCSYMYGIDEI